MKASPNFLILMVDQQRFPPVYEPPEVAAWRMEHLVTQERLKQSGLEFKRHYAGATACSPSRATLYTGQYPSLHGVTQTSGAAKSAFDPDLFWLDRNSVPTMGDYFRAGGYRTFWKGKWHASNEDILIPGTKDAVPSYFPQNGVPDPERVRLYLQADRLDPFGFTGWVGPEPHGSLPRNSGGSAATGLSGRDVVYASEAAELIERLDADAEADRKPWLIMASFVNPHDIALFGAVTELHPQFDFRIDPNVPEIPPAPTADEVLVTKPRAQQSYREVYPKALQPLRDTLRYAALPTGAEQQIWKYSRYFDNPQFWSEPGQLDQVLRRSDGLPVSPPVEVTTCVVTTKRTPEPGTGQVTANAPPVTAYGENYLARVSGDDQAGVLRMESVRTGRETCLKYQVRPGATEFAAELVVKYFDTAAAAVADPLTADVVIYGRQFWY